MGNTVEAATVDIRSPQFREFHFADGTEELFAAHVLENSAPGKLEEMVRAADEFCWTQRWMMNVGDKKGKILDEIVASRCPKTVLELGTYCGYSSLRMARLLHGDWSIVTIDPSPQHAASRLWDHAGITGRITQKIGTGAQVIPNLEKKPFDLVFIDHDKRAYLSDLILLEEYGLVASGTWVVADNVQVFHLDQYLEHVNDARHYNTRVHECLLEYTHDKTKIDALVESHRI